jgi:predicted dithiol-disulfide oxidoreductase (DUF899 family)
MHSIRFPGETAAYRTARDELLKAELALRAQVERVAEQRRHLPLGAVVPEDYLFEEGGADLDDATTVRPVRLSELFEPGKDTLVVYSFMFGPTMKQACPMCTSFLDGLEGNAQHLKQRVSFAVVAKSPIARIREFARSRGWRRMRLVSSSGNTFNRDYHGESPDGSQDSIIHIFVKRDDGVHHFYSCEAQFAPHAPGENTRHVDLMWPLWNVLDLTPGGRGADFYPKLSY